ncbi:MAG: carboxypeptidase regulatory-like domain-containing protein [Gemmatimonadota bacterium]
MNTKPSVRHYHAVRTLGALAPGALASSALLVATLDLAAQQLNPDLIRAECEVVHEIPDQSIMFGQITDGRSGLPIPGGTVYLEWVTVSGDADSTFNSTSAETTDGSFIFCDVPQDTRIVAYATALGGRSGTEEFLFRGGESERRDLQITLHQIRSGVTGHLRDSESGDPIVGATVSVPGTDLTALTDEDGRFAIPNVPIGSHDFIVRHIAYGEPRLRLTVENGQSTHITARLDPQAIALEPIAVEISTRPVWLENRGFYRRQELSLGQFVTPEMIKRRSFARFSEVLQAVPGLIVRTICSPRCFQQIGMAGATQGGCIPTFYMDGRTMHVRPAPRSSRFEPEGLIDLDALATPHDLAAVEVYRSIAETPPEFFGRCGSIVIWTKRGGG